ncbi:protein phosphatase 1 regulatory subunit 12C isoform X2 [Huso huso]|uniref:Protein phosphatase 1 regulatory subunit 12C isoform X2 n=1 Tax=Huso huso TaxID=61971 RepID=A0ABR0Y2X4_HUSHU
MADGGGGATAKAKRREQLQRWTGSTTDREPAAPRRRRRSESREQQQQQRGEGEAEAEAGEEAGQSRGGRDGVSGSKRRKTRRSVRFDRAAEFLAACACGDTEEAAEMLRECESGGAGEEGGGGGGSVINSTNADGISALHQACIDENLEMVHFLVSHGAAVNQSDNEGWTPLHVTASCGLLEITEFLLQQGALVSAVNCDGDIPLDIAEDEAMERLLQDHVTKQGVDVAAVKREEEEVMSRDAQQWLLGGVPPNVCDPKTGASPLHVAAAKGYLEVMRLLLQCGFQDSLRDRDGWTPLHAAAHWGQGEACRLLCERLCAMEALSNTGQSPFDVADESVEPLLEELQSKQAAIRTQNESVSEEQQLSQGGPSPRNSPGSFKNRSRSSVCRMSSKEKIWVQDQSKERKTLSGMSVGEEEEGEGGPVCERGRGGGGGGSDLSAPSTLSSRPPSLSSGILPLPSPLSLPPLSSLSLLSPLPPSPSSARDSREILSLGAGPDDEGETPPPALRDEGLLMRLDSDPPSQNSLNLQPSPGSENVDRRKSYQTPVRDEESESQRKARSRLMRQSRRSTQ